MDPNYERFMTRDSFEGDSADPLTRNGYLFSGGDSVNKIDPSGNMYGIRISALLAGEVGDLSDDEPGVHLKKAGRLKSHWYNVFNCSPTAQSIIARLILGNYRWFVIQDDTYTANGVPNSTVYPPIGPAEITTKYRAFASYNISNPFKGDIGLIVVNPNMINRVGFFSADPSGKLIPKKFTFERAFGHELGHVSAYLDGNWILGRSEPHAMGIENTIATELDENAPIRVSYQHADL